MGQVITMLPLLVRPEEDELLSTFITRLSVLNEGILDRFEFKRFLLHYIQPQYINIRKKCIICFKYDAGFDLSTFLLELKPVLREKECMSDILLDHTVYPFFGQIWSPYKRTLFVNRSCRIGSDIVNSLIVYSDTTIPELRMCPECVKEDGFLIYKRIHQLPGQKSCPKHHVILYRYCGVPGQEYNNPQFLPISDSISDMDIELSDFFYSVLSSKAILGKLSVVAATKNKLSSKSVSDDKQALRLCARENGRESLITQSTYNALSYLVLWSQCSHAIGSESLLELLFLTFRDMDELIQYADYSIEEEKDDFNKYALEHGYTLVSEYNRFAVTMTHDQCGTEFVTAPHGFRIGWECPLCDKDLSVSDRYKKIVDHMYDGRYILEKSLEPDAPLSTKVTVVHKDCGSTKTLHANNLIKEPITCKKCKIDKRIKHYMDALPEWELLQYTTLQGECMVRHKICGRAKYSSSFSTFRNNPICPVCNRIVRDNQSFVEKIKWIYGAKYTQLENRCSNKKKIRFRCNTCGSIFERTPARLLEGRGCIKCQRTYVLLTDEYDYLLSAITEGRYNLVRRITRNKFFLRDNQTGREFSLERYSLLRELMRPSSSPFIPVDNPSFDERLLIQAKKVLLDHLKRDKWFDLMKLDLIAKEHFISNRYLSIAFLEILPTKVIRRLISYESLFFLNDGSFDPIRIVEDRYLYDKDRNPIGFYADYSFLKYLGANIDTDTITLVSNNSTKQFGFHISEKAVYVRPPSYGPVTSENKYLYEIMTLLYCKHYAAIFDPSTLSLIKKYMKKNKITHKSIIQFSKQYPKKTDVRVNKLFTALKKI